MRRLEVEVVARPVQVRRQQEDRVQAVLLAVGLRADEDRLLGDAVRRVRLLRIAVPEVVLAERHGRVLRVRADGAGDDELLGRVLPRELEHVRTHDQVRVPVAARVGAVRADAADLGGEVVDELRPRVGEQTLRVVPARQVVVGAARDERLLAALAQALDEVRADEPAPAGDEDPRHRARAGLPASQSTRPSQRSRLSAYHRIVRRTPSSHETFGSQPVSACSLS